MSTPDNAVADKRSPRKFTAEDAKRFAPINQSYLLATDQFQHSDLVEASKRLTQYADVFARLYQVFVDIVQTERHGSDSPMTFWTEPLQEAAEHCGHLIDRLGHAIASGANMATLQEMSDPLRKMARLPTLSLTHNDPKDMIVCLTDDNLAAAKAISDEERPYCNYEAMKAMQNKYRVMLDRFQAFFSDISSMAEEFGSHFYSVDHVAALQLWRVAWHLEKQLHAYHQSITCSTASRAALEKKPTKAKGGAK